MTRTEQILRAIATELGAHKPEIDGATGLKEVSLAVRFDRTMRLVAIEYGSLEHRELMPK